MDFFFLQVYVHLVCPKEKEDTEPSSVSATVRYDLGNVKTNVIDIDKILQKHQLSPLGGRQKEQQFKL